MFKVEGEYIRTFKQDVNKYLNVQGATDSEGRHIQCNEAKNGKIHQQWDVVYADQWKGEPGNGELNEEYGLYVGKPFNIISAMGSGRYLEVINNRNMVIKTRNSQKGQIWYFDQRSLTIKTKINNQSWHIQSNGGGNKMEIQGTNSQWW
jgi:hypothetical protein